MQRHSPSMLHALLLCAAGLSTAGCGNKGDLYLKDDPNITGSDGSVEAMIDEVSGGPGSPVRDASPTDESDATGDGSTAGEIDAADDVDTTDQSDTETR